MKVLFVSPEVSPFSRTGGLGEVVGSLPLALSKIGIDTRILCPLYKETLDLPIKKLNRLISFKSQNQKITSEIGILKEELFPIPVYFLINTELLEEVEYMQTKMETIRIIGFVPAFFPMRRFVLKKL